MTLLKEKFVTYISQEKEEFLWIYINAWHQFLSPKQLHLSSSSLCYYCYVCCHFVLKSQQYNFVTIVLYGCLLNQLRENFIDIVFLYLTM